MKNAHFKISQRCLRCCSCVYSQHRNIALDTSKKMFATDKELRKGTTSRSTRASTGGRGSGSSSGSGRSVINSTINRSHDLNLEQNDNLIEKLKKERIERQNQRELNNKIILLQKIWRGKSSRKMIENLFKNECDKKLNDIENVSTILLKTKGINFIPPLNISYYLYRMLLFHNINTIQVCILIP